MNIESLHPKDGDVVVVVGAKDQVGTGQALAKMFEQRRVSCAVLMLSEGATVETADEARMLELGWVRVTPGFAADSRGIAKA